MNAKQARECIKDSPANPNPKTELAGFGFQCGGDDTESRETAGGPWFLCAECAGRLQARGCGFSSKEAGPIWGGQIHENCAVCWPAKRQQDNAKHTPGPWIAEGKSVVSENGEMEASITTGKWQENNEESRANARLIAAAPTLLMQLKNLVEVCPECGGKGYFLAPLGPPANDFAEPEPCAWCQAARAAIAQAEGGEQ